MYAYSTSALPLLSLPSGLERLLVPGVSLLQSASLVVPPGGGTPVVLPGGCSSVYCTSGGLIGEYYVFM